MPPGVDRRYASAEAIQRELKVGFRACLPRSAEAAFRPVGAYGSPAYKVKGSRPARPRVASKPRGVKHAAAPGVITQRRLGFREALRAA
jgi:hypothetical protein